MCSSDLGLSHRPALRPQRRQSPGGPARGVPSLLIQEECFNQIFLREQVFGLLPSEGEAVGAHRLQHVAVTDLGLVDADVVFGECQFQPEVAHHGDDDGVGGQPVVLLQGQGEDCEDLVPFLP